MLSTIFLNTTTASDEFDISTFTTFGTTLLTWLISTFSTVLGWMIDHPMVFIGLVMWLIVAAIGILRKLIGA